MAIPIEIRHEKVKIFSEALKKEGISFDFTDTNALSIYLSENKNHCLEVDLFNNEEVYNFKGRHDLTVAEIHLLQKILLMINAIFSPTEPSNE
jgi:hypothetical protein